MPNICGFDMKIIGRKKAIDKLLEWGTTDYNENLSCPICRQSNGYISQHYLGHRIFDIGYMNYSEIKNASPDDNITAYINGNCAWSVHDCLLRDGGYYTNNDYCICLEDACQTLGLELELFSEESGNGFAEHLVICQTGEILEYETVDLNSYDISMSDTYEKWCRTKMGKEAKTEVSEDMFDNAKGCGNDWIDVCEYYDDDFNWRWTT